MPIHEYACNTCKRVEERWFATQTEVDKFEETTHPCQPNPTKKCPGKLRRKVSASNFAVNGYNAKNGYAGGQ